MYYIDNRKDKIKEKSENELVSVLNKTR